MASDDNNIIGWLVAGGGGTILGSIIMSVISIMGTKGKDRASAADVSVSAATKMMDRLEAENVAMREAIVIVTEILDEIVSNVEMPPKTAVKLREANRAAKLSIR